MSAAPVAPLRPTFAEVYEHGADYVFRTLRRMGVPETDCPDATQETFVIVHRRLPDYDPQRRLKAWLAGISANIAKRHHEKAQRTPALGQAHDAAEGALTGGWVGNLPAGAGGAAGDVPPLDLEDAIATRALVLYLLQAVEPERRIVLILHHIDEMTVSEIAEALELPKGTAATRLRLGQQDFKAAWGRYEARSRRESGRGSLLP